MRAEYQAKGFRRNPVAPDEITAAAC